MNYKKQIVILLFLIIGIVVLPRAVCAEIPDDIKVALTSFVKAIRGGNPSDVEEQLFVGKIDLKPLASAATRRMVSDYQLRVIFAEKFKAQGASLDWFRFVIPAEEQLELLVAGSGDVQINIDNDKATLKVLKPIKGLRINGPFVLKKDGEKWKLDFSEMSHVSPTQTAESLQRLYEGEIKIALGASVGMKEDKLKTPDEVRKFISDGHSEILSKVFRITTASASRPTTSPATAP